MELRQTINTVGVYNFAQNSVNGLITLVATFLCGIYPYWDYLGAHNLSGAMITLLRTIKQGVISHQHYIDIIIPPDWSILRITAYVVG